MDGTGPEASKRQRLDSYNNVSHRLQQQPSTSQSHGFSVNTLPPPNSSYVPHPLPPSPYHESAVHEHRSLPDPTTHGYTQPHSGQNTPIRDPRAYPLDANYPRRGSTTNSTRSPDGFQQFPTARPVNSTAAGNDGQHYPQPSYPIETAGQFGGYANHDTSLNGNPQHGLPMSTYNNEPVHPNPTGHPSDYNPSPVNAVPHVYAGSNYTGPPNHQNMQRAKKGNRATQACDICRTRKAKCDEGRPACGFCVENQMQCNYQTVAPAKADRANQAILDQLASQDNKINDLGGKIEQFTSSLDEIKHLLANLSGPQAASRSKKEGVKIKSDYSQGSGLDGVDTNTVPDHKAARSSNRRPSAVDASPSGSHVSIATNASRVDAGATHGPEVPVAIEHTTAAHRLLRWPSIKALISRSRSVSSLSEDYVMTYEERKGVLRVYGKGEGQDSNDGGHPSSPTNSSNSCRSDETPEARSPASLDGLWGSGFGDAKPMNDVGGLRADGTLIIDPHTLRRLHKSYLDNIHILHPFLNKTTLNQMVESFSAFYNPDKHRQLTRLPSNASANAMSLDGRTESFNTLHKTGKRKHSDGQHQSYVADATSTAGQPTSQQQQQQQQQQPPLQKSISTAIILLVMALGKICEWHKPLPGPILESNKEIPYPRRLSYSPMPPNTEPPSPISVRQSPISSTHSIGNASIASPMSTFPPTVRRIAEDHPPGARNVDVIPGLAYYAQATDILGNCNGGNDLSHVQANLLAGLYAGQLARTFESWSWIHNACRACRYLVREPTLTKESEPRADLIRFAFWTCSQLESDILAELDLPRSGIQDVTGVNYPKGFLEQADFGDFNDEESSMMFYYSGQIHIRNVLNEIQSNLHPPENIENTNQRIILRNGFDQTLKRWRSILPARLQWVDDEDPSSDINDARLRAKYYGALYIVHRPFLRQLLDDEIELQDIQSPQSDSIKGRNLSTFLGRKGAPSRFNADEPPQTDILHSAEICVHAAMQSTIAFDGIIKDKRLIVTNIFGTAHAQFGNLMVLATTYMSKTLGFLVPKDELVKLFDRTIKFLRSHRTISTTLEQDAKILEMIRRVVFSEGEHAPSFSSDT